MGSCLCRNHRALLLKLDQDLYDTQSKVTELDMQTWHGLAHPERRDPGVFRTTVCIACHSVVGASVSSSPLG